MGVAMKEQVLEMVSNIEWLSQQLRAKTMSFEESTGKSTGIPINWEVRCGAIAELETPEQKALAAILTWGDHRDNTEDYKILQSHLSELLFNALEPEVKRKTFVISDFCTKIVRMELFFYFRPFLVDMYTLKGKLHFSGIKEVTAESYANQYNYLSHMVRVRVKQIVDEIDYLIGEYRIKCYRA